MRIKMSKSMVYVNESLKPIILERHKSYILPEPLRSQVLVNGLGFEWGYLNVDNISEVTK